MTRLLLLGAAGQLGREIAARAAQFPVALFLRTRAETDIADRQAIEAALAEVLPDLVVNAAAYTKVDQAESEPDEAFRTNAVGPETLGQVCAARDMPIVHVSTDYVFDGLKFGSYQEHDPTGPQGVYGSSKVAGEIGLRKTNSRHLILRTSWVYGAYGANFLKTMLRVARERDSLKVVADQFGSPTSTADLAEAILKLAPMINDNRMPWGTYHFAGTGVTSWYEFAREIVAAQARFTGRSPAVQPISTAEYPTAAPRPKNSALDCSRFSKTFGFCARPWRDGTRDAVTTLLG